MFPQQSKDIFPSLLCYSPDSPFLPPSLTPSFCLWFNFSIALFIMQFLSHLVFPSIFPMLFHSCHLFSIICLAQLYFPISCTLLLYTSSSVIHPPHLVLDKGCLKRKKTYCMYCEFLACVMCFLALEL